MVYYPTTFLGNPTEAMQKWKVAWVHQPEPVKIIPRGQPLQGRQGKILGKRSRQNLILVQVNTSKEQFIDAISRYFSKKLDVNPHELKFEFEEYMPFWKLEE